MPPHPTFREKHFGDSLPGWKYGGHPLSDQNSIKGCSLAWETITVSCSSLRYAHRHLQIHTNVSGYLITNKVASAAGITPTSATCIWLGFDGGAWREPGDTSAGSESAAAERGHVEVGLLRCGTLRCWTLEGSRVVCVPGVCHAHRGL